MDYIAKQKDYLAGISKKHYASVKTKGSEATNYITKQVKDVPMNIVQPILDKIKITAITCVVVFVAWKAGRFAVVEYRHHRLARELAGIRRAIEKNRERQRRRKRTRSKPASGK